MYTSDLFKKWIIDHQNDDYQINVESEQTIKLTTSYGEATIQFTDVTNGTIVEFNIISYKNQEVQFYLHFELNDDNHAHQLYDEMIETLIGLKDKKTTRVLLSCSSGLTTSMFADNLNSVVEMLGEDYHFDAVAYSNIYEQVENCDLVLIAPQIGYMLKRLQESLPDKLVLQIPTATFASYAHRKNVPLPHQSTPVCCQAHIRKEPELLQENIPCRIPVFPVSQAVRLRRCRKYQSLSE